MFSQTVEYALRAIVTIAQRDGQRCSSQSIAESTQIPLPYLSKVMQQLTRSGLVDSRRGLHGGFTLTKGPEELSILDVVNAVDPIRRIERCPLGISSHGGTLCPLHQRLDEAMARTEASFRETTLAELLSTPGAPTPLCEGQPLVSLEPPKKVAKKKTSKKKKSR